MLDRLSAPLFVMGGAVATSQVSNPRSGLLIVWLLSALVPAVVASRAGGPDSLAAMHAITPALLLAALALSSIGVAARSVSRRGARWYADLLV